MDRNGETLYPGCPVLIHPLVHGARMPVAATVVRILTGDTCLVQLDPTPGGREGIGRLAEAFVVHGHHSPAAALHVAANLDLQEPLTLQGSRLERIDT